MIETFYRLSAMPFDKEIPPEQLIDTPAFLELKHRLEYMRRRRGLMLLTGEPGTGKTAAVRAFAEKLNPSTYKVLYAPLSTVTPFDFYLMLSLEFSGFASTHKSALFKNLQKSIRDYVENAHQTPVLILDEAQYLRDKTLEEIPILLNFRMDSLDPLLLILIGHPHLEARLRRPPLRHLQQRILLRYQLPPLEEAETRQYIAHHLSRVGAKDEIFTEPAALAVYKISAGLCRQINRLCLAALNLGALEQKSTLSEEEIYRASAEI